MTTKISKYNNDQPTLEKILTNVENKIMRYQTKAMIM